MNGLLNAMRDEYNSSRRVGPAIYDVVKRAVGRRLNARKYPPRYFSTGTAAPDLDDIVQEMFVNQLFKGDLLGQLLYRARDDDHFEALLDVPFRRVMVDRMEKNVVDPILKRAVRLARDDPIFVHEGQGFGMMFWQVGVDPQDRRPTEAEIRRAEVLLIHEPKAAPGSGFYPNQVLSRMMLKVADDTGCKVGIRDLEKILRSLLTPWLSDRLVAGGDEDELVLVSDSPPSPAASEAAHQMKEEMTTPQRRVVALAMAQVNKTEIAALVGVTRPTVYKRLDEAMQIIDATTAELSGADRDAALRLLATDIEGGPE